MTAVVIPQAGAARSQLPKLNTHAAFPSVCQPEPGRILVGWRDGPSHTGGTDGKLVVADSYDGMRSWSAPRIVYDHPTLDVREGVYSVSADGTKTRCVFFTYNTPTNVDCQGWVLTSVDGGDSFGDPTRVGAELDVFCPSSPIIDLGLGNLLLFGYGTEVYTGGADTSVNWSAYVVRSADDGASWGVPQRIADGPADGRAYVEPWAAVDGGVIRVAVRYGLNDRIGTLESYDSGWTWSAPAPAFDGTGRPHLARLHDGQLLAIYRSVAAPAVALYRVCADDGWGPPVMLDAAGGQMVYASTLETAPGLVAALVGLENGTDSSIYGLYLRRGLGTTPLDDEIEGPQAMAYSRSDRVRVFDRFIRPDGPLGAPEAGKPWQLSKPGVAIVDGVAQASGNLGPVMAVSESGFGDADIEAEVRWDGNSGVGLVAHYATPTNYLLLNVEMGGAEVNLYKVRDGVATKLAGSTARTWAGHYHRLKLITRRQTLYGFVDDLAVCVGTIFDADWARLGASTWHGFRFGPAAATTIHRCRRVTISG